MKKKTIAKILIVLLIALMLCMTFTSSAFAVSTDLNKYVETGANGNAVNRIYNIMGPIIDIFRVVGIGVALIILIWIGIQYVTGSPEGKAEYKKNFIPYIVGVVIIIAAEAILTIVKNFAFGLT